MSISKNTKTQDSIDILSLHGAGNSNKHRIDYLAELLEVSNIKIHSFDFTGFGNSGVKITQSSLEIRQNESDQAVSKFQLKEPLNIMGSSMGAYNAILMLKKYSIANLFLFCPGLYTSKAFNINFGDEFTKIIRESSSWVNSDAFEILKKYTGNLFICIGEKDEVIPDILIQKIFEVSKNTKTIKLLKIPKATHSLHTFLSQNPEESTLVVNHIKSFLQK